MRVILFVIAVACSFGQITPAGAQSCSAHPYCTQMRTCAEADFYFRQCGDAARDGDHDGIPCEDLCGATMELYLERRGAGGPARLSTPLSCGSKRTCGEMASCEEARFYLKQCGISRLDADGDGTPCNKLCR